MIVWAALHRPAERRHSEGRFLNTISSVILSIFVIAAVGVLAYVVVTSSIVRIPAGQLGLVLVRGRPTGRTLEPGVNFVFTIFRRIVVLYPSIELTYRAGETSTTEAPALSSGGPALDLWLGDRTRASLYYVVRFRLPADHLERVHERLGPQGIFGYVRDKSALVLAEALSEDGVQVDDLLGSAVLQTGPRLAEAVSSALADEGLQVREFGLRVLDLGRTGDVIQATARTRHELQLEAASAEKRRASADNDAALSTASEAVAGTAWRYRKLDLWLDLAHRQNLPVLIPTEQESSASAPLQEPAAGGGA